MKKRNSFKSNSACDNDDLNANDSKDIDVMDEVSREEEKLINALKTGTVLSSDSLPDIASSLNDYKIQTEQLLNGISSKSRKMAQGNVIDSAQNNQSQPQPPQKPNHTPIYVPPKEDIPRGFSSISRIGAATRIPNRHEISKLDEKKFELKSIPSPVRPFLSRGSVAERVLIFEKCPEKTPVRQALQEKPKVAVSKTLSILDLINLKTFSIGETYEQQNVSTTSLNSPKALAKIHKLHYTTVRNKF